LRGSGEKPEAATLFKTDEAYYTVVIALTFRIGVKEYPRFFPTADFFLLLLWPKPVCYTLFC
jgi:hypothetical protein